MTAFCFGVTSFIFDMFLCVWQNRWSHRQQRCEPTVRKPLHCARMINGKSIMVQYGMVASSKYPRTVPSCHLISWTLSWYCSTKLGRDFVLPVRSPLSTCCELLMRWINQGLSLDHCIVPQPLLSIYIAWCTLDLALLTALPRVARRLAPPYSSM